MQDNSTTYLLRAADLEETSLLIAELFGVEMTLVESEVWDDYFESDETQHPHFILRQNFNAFEEDAPLTYPDFPEFNFYLDIEDHPNPDAVGRALTKNGRIDAILMSQMVDGKRVFDRESSGQ